MSVEDVLSPYLGTPLRRSGENLQYNCPFHGGDSFYIHAQAGLAFCHACNTGWALPALLQACGADARIVSAAALIVEDIPRRPKRAVLKLVDEGALLPEQLLSVTLQCPVELLNAGFSQEVLHLCEAGWDPVSECLLFHLRDHLGRLVGVSGRWPEGYYVYGRKQLLDFADSEYVGHYRPPEKGNFLWNLDKIYPRLLYDSVDDPLIVVEGFKAAMWCIQAGFTNVVALMGSYMTDAQRILIERVARHVVVFLDDDEAGRRGTARICRLLPQSLVVKCVKYPEHTHKKLQPDDLPLGQVVSMIQTAKHYYVRNSQ